MSHGDSAQLRQDQPGRSTHSSNSWEHASQHGACMWRVADVAAAAEMGNAFVHARWPCTLYLYSAFTEM
eukprot:COSAG02_NODE_2583_length_8481_cov_22.509902_1_plen_69_part_00